MTIFKYFYRCVLVLLLAVAAAGLGACQSASESSDLVERLNAINRPFDLGDAGEAVVEAEESVELKLVSIGDILMHYPWQQEFDGAGNSVFPEYFQYISDLTQGADVAFCNIEAPFAGGEPAGYPLFNMGDTMAPAVKDAGFDVVYTSHNHMLDQGNDAVFRTVEHLRNNGLQAVGSRLDDTEPNFVLVEAKGVKIAVIAYTYESSPGSINGLPVSEAMNHFVNSFTASSEGDRAEMKGLIDQSRAAGAELVLFYLHAGTEYAHEPNADQRNVAQFLIDNGVDIIFGSHVHVVQPMELLQPSDGSAPVPVYWGMGNYISGQVIEWDMELANEEGIMAELSLTWNPKTGEIDALQMQYLPLWNCFYNANGRQVNTVIPERDDVAANPSIQASGHYQRAMDAFAEIHSIVGEPLSWAR